MAGVWTRGCVPFPALQAKAEGSRVDAVIEASGDPSPMVAHTTLARLTQAGIMPMRTKAVMRARQRPWNRPDAAECAALYGAASPNAQAVIESAQKAQEVVGQSKT